MSSFTETIEYKARAVNDQLWELEQAAQKHAEKPDKYTRRDLVSESVKFTNLMRKIAKSR